MAFSFNKKRAGILIPSFAVRHEKDLGIGDTEGVKQIVQWCSQNQLSVLQLLPINETGEDHSPYNVISSRALCPTTIYLHPNQLPGLSRSIYNTIATEEVLNEIRSGSINYPKIKALKRQLLWEAFQKFRKKSLLDEFIQKNEDWLESYCLFRLAMNHNEGSVLWDKWPKDYASPEAVKNKIATSSNKQGNEEKLKFYAFVQWVAHQQWEEVKAYAEDHNVLLMGDMPFGVSRYSADVWGNRDIFYLNWSAGAPPEANFKPDLFTERWGQNWGIPLYKWENIKAQNYHWWHQRVEGLARYFHLCRVDHVLGFYRIYAFPWSPDRNEEFVSLSPEEVRQRAGHVPLFIPGPDTDPHWHYWNRISGETILKELQSAAGDMGLVAEDLGTVPDYMPLSLESLGIPGFKFPYYHRSSDHAYLPGSEYPALSVATFGTHDNAPLATQWEIWSRLALQGDEGARWEQICLLRWADLPENIIPQELSTELHIGFCKALFNSNSWLASLQISDWFATHQRFNVPGLINTENWTQRLTLTIKQISLDPYLANLSNSLKNHLISAGRGQ